MRRGSATFWAWMTSIVVHLIVFTVFAITEFSSADTQNKSRIIPEAKINYAKKLIEQAPVIPKPKIKEPIRSKITESVEKILSTKMEFEASRPPSGFSQVITKPFSPYERNLPGVAVVPTGAEFFGSRTEHRKICYLVDCSGSMKGLFNQVKKELVESIQNLQPDQYFYIIFFGGDRLFEFGGGKLVRATPKAKSDAGNFMDSVSPTGQTNAVAALKRATKIRDGWGGSPSVVYFLTDGFGLTSKEAQDFSHDIASYLTSIASQLRFNTIGFWPQAEDDRILKKIAEQTGGKYVCITDDDI